MYKGTWIAVMMSLMFVLAACAAREAEEDSVSSAPPMMEQNNIAAGSASNANAVPAPGDSEAHVDFPLTASLSYQPVELQPLVEMEPKKSWEHTRTLSLGTLDGKAVSLALYKETEPGQLCSADYERAGLLEYNNKTYYYDDCFSNSLDRDPSSEYTYGDLVELGYEHKDTNDHLIVHGAAELVANGPGRKLFMVYDVHSERWYGFNNWGTPKVVDLDDDGESELVNQFEGLHMHTPDVDIYRWNGPILEQGISVTGALMLPDHSAATMDETTHQFSVIAYTSVGLEPDAYEHYESASYIYRDGQLIRSDAGGE